MMIRKTLLVGISLAAVTAGTAYAQSTNTQTVVCSTAAGNTCEVENDFAGNDDNAAIIRVAGAGNSAYTYQFGDDNRSIIELRGDGNDAAHEQVGDEHYADTDVTGDDNESQIIQGGDENSATVTQVGDNNASGVYQGYSDSEFAEFSFGEDNVASVQQNGSNLYSTVAQGTGMFGNSGSDNSATVVQTGTGSYSSIVQGANGNVARVNISQGGFSDEGPSSATNSSSIFQTNSYYVSDGEGGFEEGEPDEFDSPMTGNLADVAITGTQNGSGVQQDGVQNSARVSILGGGSGNTGEGTGTAGTPGYTPGSRIEGNVASVGQLGRGNSVSISSGGANPGNGVRGRGNIATVQQGSTPGEATLLGTNHRATVWQRGTLDTVQITQNNNESGVDGDEQDGSIADVSTLSYNSSVIVDQSGSNTARVSVALNGDNSGGQNTVSVSQIDAGDDSEELPDDPFGGGGGTEVTPLRNTVSVSQSGTLNDIDVNQNATNANATVWQQRNSRDNDVTINQGTDSGYLSAEVDGADAGESSDLSVNVTQGGRGSEANLRQDGSNLSVVLVQSGTATAAGAAADSNNLAQISQVGSYNSATVSQTGFNLTANVDQRGTGTSARNNTVTITQTGDAHTATARQLAGTGVSGNTAAAAGPAGAPFARPAGARSAEIQILQTGATGATATAGNTATVEQQGLGQFARIEQNGRNNNAGILQSAAAVNAVAVIEQNGNGNTYYITQDAAGQYLRVQQNGTANNVITGSGPNGTTSGTPGGNGSSTSPF